MFGTFAIRSASAALRVQRPECIAPKITLTLRAFCRSYSGAVTSSSPTNNWDGAEQNQLQFHLTTQQLEKIVVDQRREGKEVHHAIYNSLIEKYAANNDFSGIVRVLHDLRTQGQQPTAFIYTQVIGAYAKNLELDVAMRYFNEMKSHGYVPHSITYSALIFSALKNNAEAKAQMLYQDMVDSESSFLHHPFLSFLRHYQHDPKKQMQWYSEMLLRKITPPPQAFVHLLRGHERNYDAAMRIFREEMPKCGVEPNDHVFSIVISIAGKHDRMADAEAIFEEMVKKGVEPSVVTYTALMSAHRRHNPKRAVELFEELLRKKKVPTYVSYSVVIEAAGKLKNLKLAKKYLEAAKKTIPALGYIYTAFIFACSQVKGAESLAAARTAFEEGYAAKQLDARAYSSLIFQYCEVNQWDRAVATFDLTSQLPISIRPFGGIVSGAIALGRFEEAERYVQLMRELQAPRATSLALLVKNAKEKLTTGGKTEQG